MKALEKFFEHSKFLLFFVFSMDENSYSTYSERKIFRVCALLYAQSSRTAEHTHRNEATNEGTGTQLYVSISI